MTHDIDRLKEKIDRLDRSLAGFGALSGMLGCIIRKPGWTTIAELALVETGLDALQRQAETAWEHYRRLVEAAELIGGG
ncbi:MAG: hypothetical protein ACREE4_22815 [Stellaceae bacterium]